MSGIKQPITDVLTMLTAIQVNNAEGGTGNLYARIWNNQLRDIENEKGSKIPIFPRPAAFLEIVSPAQFETIGIGFRSADLGFKIHLIGEFYNNDGTFEQDLAIFDLRDQILAHYQNPVSPGLSGYCPTCCGPLNCINESQDYDHENLYHYVLDFVCNFTDTKGSAFDDNAGQFYDDANPDMDSQTNTVIR